MRKTIVAIAILAVLWIAYAIWPFLALQGLAKAIERRDAAAIASYVDFAAVRVSLSQQIVETYARLTGRKDSPLGAGTAVVASSIADPIIAKLINPEAFAEMMQHGWPVTVLPEKPPEAAGLTPETLGTAWQLFVASEYGIARFHVGMPASLPEAQRFTFGFRLAQWRWRLASVQLPEAIQVRLAEELIKALQRR
jgi:hypothetical protein